MADREHDPAELAAALRLYVEDLAESGVDGFRPGPAGSREAAAGVVAAAGADSLERIREELGECRRCALADGRTNLVFGVGNPGARIVFVGEAPGRDEDLKGEPFVGEAGQILTRLISRMGLTREDVYICNVLKCRPPNNRNPQAEEIEKCGPFMLRQVQAIGPRAIVALGTFAAQTLLQTKEPISKLRGVFHDYHGIPLMPTFHPAYLLRNRGNTELFWSVWEDMALVLKQVGMPVPDVKRKGA